jgi:hypothetical protein
VGDILGGRGEDFALTNKLPSKMRNMIPVPWLALGSPETTYAGVPESLASSIRSTIKGYLNQCDNDCHAESSNWKLLFSNDATGHGAYQRVDGQGRSVIKSVALLDHPPKQIFSLLIDIARRKDYETNVRSDERMKEVNPHTFYDYYAYNAVCTWNFSADVESKGWASHGECCVLS